MSALKNAAVAVAMPHEKERYAVKARICLVALGTSLVLAACGNKDAAPAAGGAPGGGMPPPEVGVVTVTLHPVGLVTELPGRLMNESEPPTSQVQWSFAAPSGLGYIVTDATSFFQIPVVYCAVILLGALGFIMDRIIVAIRARILHWQGR